MKSLAKSPPPPKSPPNASNPPPKSVVGAGLDATGAANALAGSSKLANAEEDEPSAGFSAAAFSSRAVCGASKLPNIFSSSAGLDASAVDAEATPEEASAGADPPAEASTEAPKSPKPPAEKSPAEEKSPPPPNMSSGSGAAVVTPDGAAGVGSDEAFADASVDAGASPKLPKSANPPPLEKSSGAGGGGGTVVAPPKLESKPAASKLAKPPESAPPPKLPLAAPKSANPASDAPPDAAGSNGGGGGAGVQLGLGLAAAGVTVICEGAGVAPPRLLSAPYVSCIAAQNASLRTTVEPPVVRARMSRTASAGSFALHRNRTACSTDTSPSFPPGSLA